IVMPPHSHHLRVNQFVLVLHLLLQHHARINSVRCWVDELVHIHEHHPVCLRLSNGLVNPVLLVLVVKHMVIPAASYELHLDHPVVVHHEERDHELFFEIRGNQFNLHIRPSFPPHAGECPCCELLQWRGRRTAGASCSPSHWSQAVAFQRVFQSS